MRRHWSYLKYILRHKWFVMSAMRMMGGSLWLALIHDMSKFSPSEWNAYAFNFFDEEGKPRYLNDYEPFKKAWEHHYRHNKHHWEYWNNKPNELYLPAMMDMPHTIEMMCDWAAMNMQKTGYYDPSDWYNNNKDRMKIDNVTRFRLEYLIKILENH